MRTTLLLDMAADTFGDRIAFSAGRTQLSYSALRQRAWAGAALFARHHADTIVYLGVNDLALPTAFFAAGYAGKPFAPLNYRLPDADLRRLLARTAPAVAVVDDDMVARVEGVEGVTIVSTSDFGTDDSVRAISEPTSEENDIAVLLFTSGTTGEPKAAVLRHRHLTSYVVATVEFMSANDDEAALVSVPPYHIAGISAVLTGIYGGRRTAYLPAFSPDAWIDAAVTERITHAMMVPTMLGRVLDLLEQRSEQLPRLRALSYGGGRMPLPVIERALTDLPHVAFVNAYGLTETSSTVSILGPDDHRDAHASADPMIRRRLGSVGRSLPGLELEIRSLDGACCPAGTAGEIYVRGEQVAGEYLHKMAIADDGWFATNDAGWLDEQGFLFVDGRLDDVIVRGGENVSPGEIEAVLRAHAGVRDVAVLGMPDDRWGETVAAVIVPGDEAPSPAELAEWVRDRLRSTKTPERWEFRNELPYNETGKLLRRVLKAEMTAQG